MVRAESSVPAEHVSRPVQLEELPVAQPLAQVRDGRPAQQQEQDSAQQQEQEQEQDPAISSLRRPLTD